MIAEAATGLPPVFQLLLPVALVVAACFWLSVAVGATTPHAFDADADLDAWGTGGGPVALALFLPALFAWLLATGATVLPAVHVPDGSAAGSPRLPVVFGALLAAWRLTRFFVRPLHRLLPDEPEPSR